MDASPSSDPPSCAFVFAHLYVPRQRSRRTLPLLLFSFRSHFARAPLAAHRLCASCSTYGTRILIGPDTYNPAAETIEVRPIEIFKAASQRRRIEIYEILTPKNSLSPERERSRDHFWTGVLHYRERQWDKAVEEFTKARIPGIPDEALDFYLRRIEQARRKEGESHRDSAPLIFQIV